MKKAATFMLTDNLIKILENLVLKTGLNKSDIIRRALEQYNEKYNEKKNT